MTRLIVGLMIPTIKCVLPLGTTSTVGQAHLGLDILLESDTCPSYPCLCLT